jgi:hypothetical protein
MTKSARAAALAGLLLATAAALAAPPALAGPSAAAFQATTLNLAADGETQVAPDQAVISLGVQTHAATAAEAVRQNAEQMTAVFAVLRKAGIAERDVRTSNLNLAAEYSYPQNQPPQLSGYQASNDVSVTVDDLTRVGAVVDAVTAAGANQVSGVSFGLKDSTAAEDAARLAAVKALTAKAALYAQATGYHIVRLVNLSESGGQAPGPVRPLAMAAVAGPPTPVAAGRLTVRVDVSAVYELAK